MYFYLTILGTKMAKLTKQQELALDIIDFIHFYDIYHMVSMSVEQEEYFSKVSELIKEEIKNKHISSELTQVFKHYLICGLEIHLNKINYPTDYSFDKEIFSKETAETLNEHDVNVSISLLSIVAEKKGLAMDCLLESIENLVLLLSKENYPINLNYRLANQLLCYEYKGVALFLYKKFLDLGVLNSKKYQVSKSNDDLAQNLGLNNIFIRVGLIIEFELYRISFNSRTSISKKLSLEIPDEFTSEAHKVNLVRYYKKLIDHTFNAKSNIKITMFEPNTCLNSKQDTESFLLNIHEDFIHNRMFIKNHVGWISTLGAYYIQLYREVDEKKAIYCTQNNDNTCSYFSSQSLKKLGFTISSRNLYLQYKKLRFNQYEQIRLYHLQISQLPTLLNWDSINHFYHFSLKFISKK